MDPTKICKKCGEEKPLDSFKGSRYKCKECIANQDSDRKKWADRTFRHLIKYGTKDLY